MIDYYAPEQLEDTVAQSVNKDLGERAEVEGHLTELRAQFEALSEDAPIAEKATLALEIGRALAFLQKGEEAWPGARSALDYYLSVEDWERAADACDVLYQAGQPDSLCALGQGIWLAVTFPINPEITVQLLSHVIDDTPADSDGAAVAAATAAFIADVRGRNDKEREQLGFFAQQLLGQVARRHSNVGNQQEFQMWVARLELDQPDKFLVRLRNVVDVLVQSDWWFDRDAVQAKIPE